jgi:hypothetical protein
MRSALLLALVLVLPAGAAGCTNILGQYTQSEAVAGGPCSEETEDEDCPPGYGCQSQHCSLRCASDGECGAYRRCADNLCTVEIGTPCEDEDDYGSCSPLSCAVLDSSGQKVSGYCTDDPYYLPNKQCPPGFTSDDEFSECRKL